MKTFDEILKSLKDANIKQDELDWTENIPEEIWDEMSDRITLVRCGMFVDKCRWHETSVTVIKMDDRFMGIDHVSDVFSEKMYASDVNHTMEFFEMAEVNQPTYVAIV